MTEKEKGRQRLETTIKTITGDGYDNDNDDNMVVVLVVVRGGGGEQ